MTVARALSASAVALGLMLVLAAPAMGWSPEPARYAIGSRQNVAIPMRDGTVLRADVYFPATASGAPAPGPFPVLVSETPYDRQAALLGPVGQGVTGYDPYLVARGYVQAVVDVRGTGDSGGTFVLFGPQETADSVQVIDWAARLPNASGRVGMTGESYLGIVQLNAAAAVGRHSPLRAIFPITASNDPFREIVTSGGIVNTESDAALGALYGGLAMLAPLPQAASDPALLATLRAHAGALSSFSVGTTSNVLTGGDEAYDGAYWQARAPGPLLPRIVANGIPAYMVNGLWDVYQEGAPLNYAALQNAWAHRRTTAPMTSRQRVTGRYQLLMKATYHGDVETAGPSVEPVKLAWFDRWLKGERTGIDSTRTPLHLTDASGRRFDVADYPLAGVPARRFYLAAGALTAQRPTAAGASDRLAYTGATLPCDRATEQWALGGGQLVLDAFGLQDPCARGVLPESVGPGQLTYATPPFPRRTLLAGPIDLTIYASASTRETEWVAELADRAPDGSTTDLTQGALLGSLRAVDASRSWRAGDGALLLPWHPLTRASRRPVTPGAITRFDVDIRPIFATLEPGHRLVLTVLSSQTPHLLPIPAQQAELLGGVYRVQRNARAASYLELPLL